MLDVADKVAKEICIGDVSLSPQRWLEEEVNSLALRISGPDEIPLAAILSLAQLSASGPMIETELARATGQELWEIEICLDALCEYKLARECSDGFEATHKGKEAFRAIGTNMVIRKRLEMKARFDHLTRLYEQINMAWEKE